MKQAVGIKLRTQSGQLGFAHFVDEPVIWVEGDDDVLFFSKLLGTRYRVKPAGGRCECEKLVEKLIEKDLPYGVILDGDYDILGSKGPRHQRVVRLGRYAIENYFLEPDLLETISKDLLKAPLPPEGVFVEFQSFLETLNGHLLELIIRDIGHCAIRSGHNCFPDAPNEFFRTRGSLVPDVERIAIKIREADSNFPNVCLKSARDKVRRFFSRKQFKHLIRGHFAFGVVWHYLGFVMRTNGKKFSVSSPALLVILCNEVWRCPNPEHKSLKRRVRRLARDVYQVKNRRVF